jgi:hypothetical protein
LFTWSAAASAQTRSSSSSANSGGSGFTGSSGGSGFTGSSGGSGFTGSSGGSFTGNSSSFTGSSGGSFTGTSTYSGGRGGGGSSTTIPTQSNLFQSYYANPMAAGMGTNGSTTTRSVAFGQPLYKLSTSGTSNYGNRSSVSGYASSSTSSGAGSTIGMRRDAAYATVVDSALRSGPPAAPLTARADLQQVIARSSSLSSKDNIKVMTDGSVVVLQGTVANEAERRLAEGLVRLNRGVYEVRNELQVGAIQATTANAEKKP